MMGNSHPFLDRPNHTKQLYDGEFLIASTPAAFAPGCANRIPPQQYLIRFGGASMQGWRKYQEDRIAIMQLIPGRPPLCNSSSVKSSTPSPSSISMLFLSVFDGHGGSETSDYAAKHFHSFLRTRVEDRMRHWKEQQAQPITLTSSNGSGGGRQVKRRHSASNTITRTMSHMSRTSSMSLSSTPSLSSALPPHPIDSEFLSKVFLEFDASIPLPAPEAMPRNSPQSPNASGLRRQQQTPIGNNIPHLASGTTATVCVIDLMNNHVVIAHIGDSRAVAFSGMKDLTTGTSNTDSHQKRTKRMSPVSEEQDATSAAAAAASSSSSSSSSTLPNTTASTSTSTSPADRPKIRKKKSRDNQQSNGSGGSGSGSLTAKQTRKLLRGSDSHVTEQPSTNFLIQYHSRDHHPDDPIEQQRIQSGLFATTFLNHQPPTRSRVCHSLQRISLNVVRGFGDSWFKLEESAAQHEQMVCAVPDCWFAKFPMALPGTPAVQDSDPITSSGPPSHRRVTSTARTESPTNSRSTTPVLAAPTTRVALPPTGETLYVVIASDGIWNSEFPTGTDGVSIKHGSASLVKTNPATPVSNSGSTAAAATPSRPSKPAGPIESPKSLLTPASSAASSSVPISSPSIDMEDDVLPTLTQDEPEEEDHPHDGEEKSNTVVSNVPANHDSTDFDTDDDASSGWSGSSSEDEDWPDMQVNMAVSQYFYNHAQPIVNRQVQEIVKTTRNHSKAELKEQHAASLAHPILSVSAAAASSSSSSSFVHGSPRSDTNSSNATTIRADSKTKSHRKHAASNNPFPPTEDGYSSIVASALDLLSAPVPLTKQNLKSTDNMSAWLISITPIGVGTTCNLPVCASDDPFEFISPPPRLTSLTSSLAALTSPTRQHTTFAVPTFRSVANQIQSPSSATSDSSTPATPRYTSFVTPPLVHQHSEPTMTDHSIPSIRAASMPHASAPTIAEQSSIGQTKAASVAEINKPQQWPLTATLSTVPPFAKTSSFVTPMVVSPSAATSNVSATSKHTTPKQSIAHSSSPSSTSSSNRKRRRDIEDEEDEDNVISPNEVIAQAFESPDPSATVSPPIQSAPSHADSIADLLFSGTSTSVDSTSTHSVAADVDSTSTHTPSSSSRSTRKRQTKDRSHVHLAIPQQQNLIQDTDVDMMSNDEPRSTRSSVASSSLPSSTPSSPSSSSHDTSRSRKKSRTTKQNTSSASVASASSNDDDASSTRRASLRSQTPPAVHPHPHTHHTHTTTTTTTTSTKSSKSRASLPSTNAKSPTRPSRHSSYCSQTITQVTTTPTTVVATSLKSGQLQPSTLTTTDSNPIVSPATAKRERKRAKKSPHTS